MKECVKKCLGQVTISCQAYEDTPLYGADIMAKMAQCAIIGGAKAVRACWPQDIKAIRAISDDLVIIGINKILPEGCTDTAQCMDAIFITPTYESAVDVIEAGADIVAIDCCFKEGRTKEELKAFIEKIKTNYPETGIMADCATYEECMYAAECGVDIVSTTLSFPYKTKPGPDTDLVRRLKESCPVPVNAEGSIWELADIKACVDAGADMICVGTAVTRPHEIAKRFINFNDKCRAN